jgi:hypothetical protein
MSSHAARAAESEVRALRKSGGTLCRAPPEIPVLDIGGILPVMSHRLRPAALAFGSVANSWVQMTAKPELIQLLRIASASPTTHESDSDQRHANAG